MDNLTVASSTDTQQAVTNAALADEPTDSGAAARTIEQGVIDETGDGSVVSVEHPRSERTMLLERMETEAQQAEEELRQVEAANTPDEPGNAQPNAADTPPQPQPQPSAQQQPAGSPAFLMRVGQLAESAPEAVQALYESTLPIPAGVFNALASDPAGADVACALAQNPDVVEELKRMPIETAIKQTYEILGVVKDRASRAGTVAAMPRKAISKAPPPIEPVGGSSTSAATKDPDRMEYQEFCRWRETQSKARFKR